jgi:aldehyde dehydrogenase (NAD+)
MQRDKRQWAEAWLGKDKSIYINGRWKCASGKIWHAINPANKKVLGSYNFADANQVDSAVQAASDNFEAGAWRKLPRAERINTLRRIGQVARDHRAELATLASLENGKLYSEAYNDDLPDTADIWDYYSGWVDKINGETLPADNGFINYTVKEPVGVCALIVPWNYPLLIACWKMAPALAMGNSVIIKPSEHTSYSLIRWMELVHENVNLPPGTLNMVLGDGETGSLFSHHAKVNKVAFTGSTVVGKAIVNASSQSNLKSVSLELGGKSPNILFEDTPNLDAAIDRSFQVMFSQKGEKCSEPTRIIIHEKIYDKVLAVLIKKAEAVVCGDPFDEKSTQGAQCNEVQYKKIISYLELGKKEGARCVAGGNADLQGDNASGYYIRPTIFADVNNKSRLAQEEIFGPILIAIPFTTEAEAIEIANDTPYGLAAGLYTADISRAHRVAAKLDAGSVFINRYGCYDLTSPFGGFKQSGWGKDMGRESLDSYTKSKSIWIQIDENPECL